MTEESSVAFVETPSEIAKFMVDLIESKKTDKVLDSGCGKGVFLNELLNAGYNDVDGIELNEERYRHCVEQYPNATLHNSDFLSGRLGTYDVIIGNPPYMHFDYLPDAVKNKVHQIVGNMECDIYYAFTMKAIDLLNPVGELIYIVPYHFFYNTYADEVRDKLVRKGHFDVVIDLEESALFKDNNPETIIFKWKKVKAEHKMDVLRIKERTSDVSAIVKYARKSLEKKQSNRLFHFHRMDQYKAYEAPWSSRPRIDIPHHRKLGDVADIKVGLLAGYSDGFTVTRDEYESIPESERGVIFPFVKAKHCAGYWVDGFEWKVVLGNKVRNEDHFSSAYPSVYGLMKRHKKEMEDRYRPNGMIWYEWSALRNKTYFETHADDPKLFVPAMDRHQKNRFSLCETFVFGEGDVVAIIPKSMDAHFLLGYLNSDFFREYFLSHGSMRGGRVSFLQGVLSGCKVPYFTKNVMNDISKIARRIYNEKNDSFRTEIDEIIRDAFKNGKFRKFGISKYF